MIYDEVCLLVNLLEYLNAKLSKTMFCFAFPTDEFCLKNKILNEACVFCLCGAKPSKTLSGYI